MSREQFEDHLRAERAIQTEEQKAALELLQSTFGLTPMEDPLPMSRHCRPALTAAKFSTATSITTARGWNGPDRSNWNGGGALWALPHFHFSSGKIKRFFLVNADPLWYPDGAHTTDQRKDGRLP